MLFQKSSNFKLEENMEKDSSIKILDNPFRRPRYEAFQKGLN